LQLNDRVLQLLDGEVKEYRSLDRAQTEDPDDAHHFPLEFLHSLTPSGMPPHRLQLKVGAVVMLLRNMSVSRRLCNGTRLIVRAMHPHLLECEPLLNVVDASVFAVHGSPPAPTPRVLLPRIQLISGEERMPFQLSRRQFPVRLAFAMTINKSQGQTFDKIGVYLPRPVFAHGQLYVAFSRVRRMEDVSVMLDRDGVSVTRNVVHRELLRSELRGDEVEEKRVEAHDEDDIVPPELEHKYDEDDDDDEMPPLIPAPPSLHPYVHSVRSDPPAAATGAAIARRPLSDVTNVARPSVSARKRARECSGPSRKRGGAGSAATAQATQQTHPMIEQRCL
jgi:hypothetical protein